MSRKVRSTPTPCVAMRRTVKFAVRAFAFAEAHHGALENLDALAVTFDDARMHFDAVAGFQLGIFRFASRLVTAFTRSIVRSPSIRNQ